MHQPSADLRLADEAVPNLRSPDMLTGGQLHKGRELGVFEL